MRTTVTLDPDVERLIRDAMKERDISFKEALNEAARIGLGGKGLKRVKKFAQKSFRMGEGQEFRWDKAWRLPTQSRTKNSAESSHCVNDAARCEPSDLRGQRGRPIKPEGEGLAGIGFVRTGSCRIFVECTSRIPAAHHSPGLVPAPATRRYGFDLVASWLAQPSATIVHAGPRHLQVLRELLLPMGTGGNLTSDAHLAALAIEHRAELCSLIPTLRDSMA